MRLILGNTRLLTLAFVAAVVLAWTPSAVAQEQPWALRVHGTWSYPTGEFDVSSPEGQRITATTNEPLGFAVAIEYRPIERLGLEFAGTYARPTVDAAATFLGVRTEATGDLLFMPLSGSVNLHMTPGKPVDIYAGASLVYSVFGDMDLTVPGEGRAYLRGDNDLGWGMHLGVDVPFGRRGWSFSADVRYLSTTYPFRDMEDDMDFEMKFNPFVIGIGVSARF